MSKTLITKISRYLVGALFIFSGFAKGVNPFGLSVQFSEYFSAMGLDFMSDYAIACAVLLPMVEMTLGMMLILGIYRKVTAWVTLAMMGFFTALTLWIALYNPVKDCGCFGDLLKISNWATFYKNLCFMLPAVVLFMFRGQGSDRFGWRTVLLALMACGMLPLYCYNNLPLLDGTAFKVGTNVWEAMHDGVADKSATVVRCKNLQNGDVQEFELSDKEWQDTSKWEFVESVTEVIEAGTPPTISQLPMVDHNGVDQGERLLRGDLVMIVSPNPTRQSAEIADVISNNKNAKIVLLHSSLQVVQIPHVEVLSTDLSTLKALVQSPYGGVIFIEGGVIVGKVRLY